MSEYPAGAGVADDLITLHTNATAESKSGTLSAGNTTGGNLATKPVTSDAILYVSTNGNDTNDGFSAGSAKLTIAAAIAIAPARGAVINVLGGNIQLSGSVAIAALADLTIQGIGPNATNIIVNGNYDAFTLTGVCSRIRLRDMWIGSFAVRASGWAINLAGSAATPMDHIALENIQMQNTAGGLRAVGINGLLHRDVEYIQSFSGAMKLNAFFAQSVIGFRQEGHGVVANTAPAPSALQNDGVVFDSDCDTILIDSWDLAGYGPSVANLLNANDSGFETDISGWAVGNQCTIAQSAAQAHSGTKSLAITSTGGGGNAQASTTGQTRKVIGSAQYQITGWSRAAATANGAYLFVQWYDVNNTYISATFMAAAVLDTTTGWTQVSYIVNAPANATSMAPGAGNGAVGGVGAGPPNGEVHYWDDISAKLVHLWVGFKFMNSLGAGHTGPRLVRARLFAENVPGDGVDVLAGRDIKLIASEASGNNGIGFYLHAADFNVEAQDCWSAQNGKQGFYIDGNINADIGDCFAQDNGTILYNTYDGIRVESNDDFRIHDNRSGNTYFATGAQRYGISIGGGSTNGDVHDNNCQGNLSAAIANFGTPSVITHHNNGYNPVGLVVVTVPATGVAVAAVGYDRTFYITTAAGVSTFAIQGGPTITIPASGFGTVRVPAGQTLTPTYANAPSWVVEGE